MRKLLGAIVEGFGHAAGQQLFKALKEKLEKATVGQGEDTDPKLREAEARRLVAEREAAKAREQAEKARDEARRARASRARAAQIDAELKALKRKMGLK